MEENFNLQPEEKKGSTLIFIWEFLKVIIMALVIILPIRYFIFQPFIVSGSSMKPNFENGEYLVIDEVSYRFREPARGDVLVLKYPIDPKQYFIKRVVGLPGEKISIDNGRVTIYNNEHPEGFVIEEPYLESQGLTFPHNNTIVGGKNIITLKIGEYFMLGDNRVASSDSRDWGPLTRDQIVGRVFIRVLPLTEFGTVPHPEYSI
jgi:signal peptidase I